MSMNRFFRCQYDSNMMSKFPESLKIACIDSEYVSDRDTVFGKCRNEEKCKHVTHKIVEFPAEQMIHFNRNQECQHVKIMPSKFPESLKIAYTDLEYVPDRERAFDIEMLKYWLDAVQGEFGESNQFKCSYPAHRCRRPNRAREGQTGAHDVDEYLPHHHCEPHEENEEQSDR